MPEIILNDGKEPILLRNYDFGWEACWKRNRLDPETKEVAEQYWAAYKWFANLPAALNAVAEYKLRASDATTLAELQDSLVTIRKELYEVYNANIGK